ncbi:N-alpha-acetyltransferase, non-catalitic subunit [Coemansia sp. RSA 2131]|nr:N-alpha-acetyltransferase, non-catalitic subunit [Coemansia sp. RSA 2131]
MADSEQLSSGLSGLSLDASTAEVPETGSAESQLTEPIITPDGEWIDITTLVDQAASELASGALIKQTHFTLFDAMMSVEVMDPRLDMGILTADDALEASQWDIDRQLTLREALWVALRLLRCEITWHGSASLLQTLYTCNYFTASVDGLPIGHESANEVRDVVLFPIVIATGVACRYVWNEFSRYNLFGEEDVQMGTIEPQFFADFSERRADILLYAAHVYLGRRLGEPGARELSDVIDSRRRWLRALGLLSAERMLEDADAAANGLAELRRMHAAWPDDEGTHVRGVFDTKCMRRYAAAAPIKPRELMEGPACVQELERMAKDLELVESLGRVESVEHLVYMFQKIHIRAPSPFVRSLLMTMLANIEQVVLGESPEALVRRAVLEVSAAPPRALAGLFANGDVIRVFLDWFRTLAQNPPRARRVALKCLGTWDALQGEAEQADIDAFGAEHPGRDAADPAQNPFWVSSWAYHMKLMLLEGALLGGVRLHVYAAYELPVIFGYATQVFEAHAAHLDRMHMGAPGAARTQQLQRVGVLVRAQREMAVATWLISHMFERLLVFRAPWHSKHSDADTVLRLESTRAQRARYALRFRHVSMLGSPTHLSFDGWCASAEHLDECLLHELLVHAQNALNAARTILGDAKNHQDTGNDSVVDAWADACRMLYAVVVANLVAMARLQQSGVLRAKELMVSGAAALEYRQCFLQADADDAANDRPVRSKKQRKDIERARKWRDAVEALVSDKLNVTCIQGAHPDWPVFSVPGA